MNEFAPVPTFISRGKGFRKGFAIVASVLSLGGAPAAHAEPDWGGVLGNAVEEYVRNKQEDRENEARARREAAEDARRAQIRADEERRQAAIEVARRRSDGSRQAYQRLLDACVDQERSKGVAGSVAVCLPIAKTIEGIE
ncbi:MAG: hypothetical protein V4449_00310 [Patescibacteria group bacterium]